MVRHGIEFREDAIADFCRRNRIQRLSLFGAIVRDDFGPESDIDVLVEFEPDGVPGLFRLAGIERELGALFGRAADLNTPKCFRPVLRETILREVEVVYDGPVTREVASHPGSSCA
jgi:predicted nucleotidyltransferase